MFTAKIIQIIQLSIHKIVTSSSRINHHRQLLQQETRFDLGWFWRYMEGDEGSMEPCEPPEGKQIEGKDAGI